MEEGGEEEADEETHEAGKGKHLDQVGHSKRHRNGKEDGHGFHGQPDEERAPRVVLASVPAENDPVHVVDNGEHQQRVHGADIKTGEQDDVVGEGPQRNGVPSLGGVVLGNKTPIQQLSNHFLSTATKMLCMRKVIYLSVTIATNVSTNNYTVLINTTTDTISACHGDSPHPVNRTMKNRVTL